MRLPFTIDQFFSVFARYNEAIWPAQWLLVALGATAVVLSFRSTPGSARAITVLLGCLWIWTGAVYHLLFFRTINPAAAPFGVLFIAEGLLFLWLGAYRRRLVIAEPAGPRRAIGALIVLYALVIYPALGYLLGHRYPEAPTFGAPCPTAILTLGLLVWAAPRLPWVLLVAPVMWALIGTSLVREFGMLEDLGLLVAAIIAIVTTLGSRRAGPRIARDARRAVIVGEPSEVT